MVPTKNPEPTSKRWGQKLGCFVGQLYFLIATQQVNRFTNDAACIIIPIMFNTLIVRTSIIHFISKASVLEKTLLICNV